MNNRTLAAAAARSDVGQADDDWAPGPDRVVVGKDVLELLSTSMYVDPMTIYREYVQNAADAIDEARVVKLLEPEEPGKVAIHLDATTRSIRICDNGVGLTWDQFRDRMCNVGASVKRGSSGRGFRGVGRLAGLGYCQELVFRSRSNGQKRVSELRWDCRRLKAKLRSLEFDGDLSDLIRDVVSIRRVQGSDYPRRFFEVELKGVVRHRNDGLLNPHAVGAYLSQVAPLPFAPEFRFGDEITAMLAPHVALGNLDLRINGAEQPIYRPHQNYIEINDGEHDRYADLLVEEIPDVDGGTAAIVWILHHSYSGAIPQKAHVKGLRLRSGNMQVGDHALLENLFPEPRFNAWSVGEIHVLDNRLVPNGRRDHFEQSVHFDNLLNQIAPLTRDIARRCRQSSATRKWVREFELEQSAALERAEAVARGGLSKPARQSHAASATRSLVAMEKIVNQRHLDDDARVSLTTQLKETQQRVDLLIADDRKTADRLAIFSLQQRSAYERVISLIYHHASNRAAAGALVEKILASLESEAPNHKSKKIPTAPKKRKRKHNDTIHKLKYNK